MTPQQLLLKTYDLAISSCQNHKAEATNGFLKILIDSLDFNDEDTKETSNGLLRIYKHCQEQLLKENYEVVTEFLNELRTAWIKAFEI